MASGKTTAATALGTKLGWTVTDLDVLIESQTQQTISEIFTTHGEEYFRAAENRVLRKLLPHRHTVCLLYTSPSPRDGLLSRMPSSA